MEFTKYKEMGAYHWEEYKTPCAYRDHANQVREWVKEPSVLDVGAGDGLITSLIGAVGVDDNELAVSLAKEKGVDVRVGSAYRLPFKKGAFQAVFSGDVIEHLEYPQKAIDEMKRVTKKGGSIYIATPPRKGDTLQDPFHVKEYTQDELIAEVGLECLDIFEGNYRIYAKFKNS